MRLMGHVCGAPHVKLTRPLWVNAREPEGRGRRSWQRNDQDDGNARTLITCHGRGMLTAAKLALRSIEWLSSDLGAPFPERGGVTSAIVGSSPERRPRGGSTAGWRKRQSCSLSTATVMVVMLSPSIRFRAHICRFPMTCVFARLIRRPSLRNCGQFRGQVGTTSGEPGGCRSVRLRSFGADGRASKRLPDMRTRSLSLSAAKWLSHDAASRPPRRRNRTIRGAILKRSYDDESQAIVAPRRRRLQLRPREPHLEV